MMKGNRVLLLLCVFLMMVAIPSFGADVSNDGKWKTEADGDIIPIADSSYDIGESGSEVANVFTDVITLDGTEYTSLALGSDGHFSDDGTSTTLDTNPTEIVITNATGGLLVEGLTVDTDDITLDNGQVIDGGTNNKIILGDNSDTFTIEFTSADTEFNSSDGGVIFDLDEADGTVDIRTSNDDDDYLQFSTSGNEPLINSVGTCDLNITSSSGEIDFGDDNLTSTGTLNIGVATASTVDVSGWIFLAEDEAISNGTDDTILITSNDEAAILEVQGYTSKDGTVKISDNAGANYWTVESDTATSDLQIGNDGTLKLTIVDSSGLVTTTGDVTVAGTTPLLTVGDGGAEAATIAFDGNTTDFHAAFDTTSGSLMIGTGTVVGTTEALTISKAGLVTASYDMVVAGVTPTLTIGDTGADDAGIEFDSNTSDFWFAYDTSAQNLAIGTGDTIGTTKVLTISNAGLITASYDIVVAGDTPTLTLGDGGQDDGGVLFNSFNYDFYMGNDYSGTELVIGTGNTIGTTEVLTISNAGLVTASYDMVLAGVTPTLTIGDTGAEDAGILFDSDTADFWFAYDTSAQTMALGTGNTVGTTPVLSVSNAGLVTASYDIVVAGATPTITIGDGGTANDAGVLFDNVKTDFWLSYDTSAQELGIGTGNSVGTTPALSVLKGGQVVSNNDMMFGDASTDKVTLVSRLIVRHIAATYSTACTSGEIVFCTGDSLFYGATGDTAGSFVALSS